MSSAQHISVHEEVELSEMEFDEGLEGYLYDCPCGDEFYISITDLKNGLNIAECPSCSLKIRVLFDHKAFMKQFGQSNDTKKVKQSIVVS